MVVGVQPGVKRGAPLGLGLVGAGVGPLVEQGAVEAFCFAVGLGPVGADPFVGDAGGGQGLAPGEGLVAGPVIGHDPLGGDPGGAEPGAGAVPERHGGVFALIAEDLAVGQAGVVIDGGVQVAVADDGPAMPVTGAGGGFLVLVAAGPPGGAPAAAIRDVPQLLDVDMDQLARRGALIPADYLPAGPVQGSQRRAAVAGQHLMHGGRIQAQAERDPGGAQPPRYPQPDDPPLGPYRRAPGTGARPRGPATHHQQRTGPAAAGPSQTAGHYGGPRGPPGVLVRIVVIHTKPGGPHLFKIICRVALPTSVVSTTRACPAGPGRREAPAGGRAA